MISLHTKHFLKLLDFSPADITALLDMAAELKRQKKAGIPCGYLLDEVKDKISELLSNVKL